MSAKDSQQKLADVCASIELHREIVLFLDNNGYKTPALVAHALPKEEMLEQVLEAMLVRAGLFNIVAPGAVLSWEFHPETAKCRRLWTECWSLCSSTLALLLPPFALPWLLSTLRHAPTAPVGQRY